MTDDEIRRRIRALASIPQGLRPFTFRKLEKLSGVRRTYIHATLRAATMRPKTSAAIGRAFEEMESQGGQGLVSRVRMTPTGPVLEWVGVNPMALPELPPVNKEWKLAK